jgi:hypothetical protein
MIIVDKQPPPSFFAPYPASKVLKILFMRYFIDEKITYKSEYQEHAG